MNLLPKSHEEFSHTEYWNTFFKKRGKKAFEWYGEYPELCGLLHKYIKPKDVLLMIGCGNSTLSADMYDVGYRNITNIDISHVVIRQMQETHGRDRPDMVYEKMDALHTAYSDEQFSVVLDKGTLDALMPDDSEESKTRIDQLFQEVGRLLRVGGRYVCVSLLQEHILNKLLEHFPAAGWMVRICRCLEAEEKANEESEDNCGLPVFVVVCTKFKIIPGMEPCLELSVDGTQLQRVTSPDELAQGVRDMQQSAMVCNRLARSSVAGMGEVSLDLHRPGEEAPRFTVHVLDQPYARNSARRYAAFIVPQGRETEWLFCTPDGRSTMLKSAGYDRLAVCSLHRNNEYESLASVQLELSASVRELAPPGLPPAFKIPFLSVGADVGRREVLQRGCSPLSGEYVVEEVELEGGEMCRRLVFLANQGVVQSEARLKTISSRKGKTRQVVDVGYLSCEHHTYMTAAVALAAPAAEQCHVALIGLGGGGLCSFLKQCFDNVNIVAVDIDPTMLEVATSYFDFVQDERLVVKIQDGIQFIHESVATGVKYHALLFDVDSKDPATGMSCPPVQFLDPTLLLAVKNLLHDQGVFVLNLVCRKAETRETALSFVKNVFPKICSYKLRQEVNEVIVCSNRILQRQDLEAAATRVNSLAKLKKLHADDIIDLTTFLAELVIDQ